ncbi:hypothetical protein [Candidatus Palauibacter sp.]|uniref:hypothetical protein n=1 Tax=Candidatus Palauibacter sp. TaxID=3101350 RepID=UPI003D1440D3
MPAGDETLLASTRESLERVQGFEVESLVREKELGAQLAFTGIVEPALRLIGLLDRIPSSTLDDMPNEQLQALQNRADTIHNIFTQVAGFTTAQSDPKGVRDSLINQIVAQYQPCFNELHPLIAYSHYRAADFQSLEREARETRQRIEKSFADGEARMGAALNDIQQVLAAARTAAAEVGVSQQAIHFQDAADDHKTDSDRWQKRTVWTSGVLFAVAVFFLFARNLGLDADNVPEAIQLAVAKVLVFATVSYAVYLCARNFLAHKHNAIVNKHRQNALLTYTTLAEAAHSRADQDVVLTYAAACTFGPQPTGYTKDGGEGFMPPNSVIGLVKDAAEGKE